MNFLPRTRLATVGMVLLLAASVSHATNVSDNRPRPTSSSHHSVHNYSHRRSKSLHKPRGQQAIDGGRAHQIQEALVREHYLSGQPSGVWDGPTQEAMRRYQQDQGWQSKTVPDSRALIRLGLGPDHQHLLNPESAMTTGPALPRPQAKTQGTASSTAKSPASLAPSTGTSSTPVVSPGVTMTGTPQR